MGFGANGAGSYFEYKYLIEPQRAAYCRNLLSSLYPRTDPYPAGWIETVYYDTLIRSCFRDCASSLGFKRKFRLRRYEDTGVIQAQVKEKFLGNVKKWKTRMARMPEGSASWQTLERYAENNFVPMSALASAHGCLLPAVRIRYQRHRFQCQNDRFNLDEHIQAQACPGYPYAIRTQAQAPFALLEIKTASHRPLLPFLGLLNLKQVSFSKFYFSLQFLQNVPDILNKYAG